MHSPKPKPLVALLMRNRAPLRVIWSAIHTGRFDEDYFHRVIDRAADEGVDGVELSGRNVSVASAYRAYPKLATSVDVAVADDRLAAIRRLSEHSVHRNLRFGIWHHEIHAPDNWLDRMPELRAADGLIDLDNPLLYRFITDKVRVFLDACPQVGEIVLTMTETLYPVFRRPFCAIPVPERVRRVLEAVIAATEPLCRRLVIRPFSALREDELHVREAIEQLSAKNVSVMYKTEPFDWHPYLMNEPLIGSIPRYEARAETDSGAEYYGQGVFPCSYSGHLEHRLRAAVEKGAATVVLRVDRGAVCPSLGNPVNEGNVIAPTRWARTPTRRFRECWEEWFRERHHAAPEGWFDLFEATFEVIGKSLYIGGQSYTHHKFPNHEHIKHVQGYGLFEENVTLSHMARNWGVLSDRRTLTHEAILAEKQEALATARKILADFDARAASLPRESREALRPLFARLPLLAETCLQFCRLALAHLEEVWKRPARCTADFACEAGRLRELADRIDRELGPEFWKDMAPCMRGIADALETERQLEFPLRQNVEARPALVDYVLCGFASEGHCLGKMLHSGRVLRLGDRLVRATGSGPDEGFGYTLRRDSGRPHRLTVTLAGQDGRQAPVLLDIGGVKRNIDSCALTGLRDLVFDVPPAESRELRIHLCGATSKPCLLASLVLERF